MLDTRKELKETLQYEKTIYRDKLGRYQCFLALLKNHPRYIVWKYVKLLRIAGYYYANRNKNPYSAFMYIFYCRRKNNLGQKLGIELNEKTFEKGLELFHTVGTVVNGDSRIGRDCKLHGNNCIGTNGYTLECPILGDNVRLGVGAKILGNVTIADNIVVAAGAVVVNSFLEKGVTIGGIPAHILKRPVIDTYPESELEA